MTGNELAAHLRSLLVIVEHQGERRINGLTFEICDGVEFTVYSAATERQRKRRKGGGGTGPPSVTPDASPALQERDVERDKNESPSVTTQEAAPPSLAPSLHSPPSQSPANSALSSSSKALQVGREADDDGDDSRRFKSVTPSARVTCPGDLELHHDQRASLLASMIPAVHIDAIVRGFRARYAGDESDLRTIEVWRRCAVAAVNNAWSNRRTRVLDDDGAAAPPRPAPRIQLDYKPPELGEIPPEVIVALTPKRAPAGPRKSVAEQLEALKRFEAEEAAAGLQEPEAVGNA